MHPLVAVVGDFDGSLDTHRATNAALGGLGLSFEWTRTDGDAVRDAGALTRFDGFWIAPSSPYRSMDGALAAIRFAREAGTPLVAT